MSTTTTVQPTTTTRSRIGWALVTLGDTLQDIAYRITDGETPTRDVPSADAMARLGLTETEATR